jgi:acetyl-CoA synthetase
VGDAAGRDEARRGRHPRHHPAAGRGPARPADTARSILEFARDNLAPYQRIRRLEFAELPKTISGKIRRVELRGRETTRSEGQAPAEEFTL